MCEVWGFIGLCSIWEYKLSFYMFGVCLECEGVGECEVEEIGG